MNEWSYRAFGLAVLSSLVAWAITASADWFPSKPWEIATLVGLLVLAGLGALGARTAKHRYAGFKATSVELVEPMDQMQAEDRIRGANSEIWSFQISGSEFTARSIETYEAWLRDDSHHLLIAFANPDNLALMENIVKLSGVGKNSDDDEASVHLQAVVSRGITNYLDLQASFPEQVDLRIYDFSPPYSVHAVDPYPESDAEGSLFVELYLPDLPSRSRPCMLLTPTHTLFDLYRRKSLDWFEESTQVRERGDPPVPSRRQI